jgi:hypothetical protein
MTYSNKIFLLPLQAKNFRNVYISPKSIKNVPEESLNPNIEKIRKKVFNPELDELIQKVSQKKKELETIREKTLEIFSEEDSTSLNYLNQVFSSRNKKLSLTKYLSYHLEKQGIYSFLLSSFNYLDGLYYPELYLGISPHTGDVMYFHTTGKYLKGMQNNTLLLPFDEKLATDSFFRKKIDTVDFENFSGMYIQRFTEGNLVGLLSIFYKVDEYDLSTKIENLKDYICKFLSPIYPTINLFFKEQLESRLNKNNKFNFYQKILEHVRSPILRGEKEIIHILKININNFFQVGNPYQLKENIIEKLTQVLTKDEILIESNCNEFFCITGNNKLNEITDCLKDEKSFQFLISASTYPDNDKNFYLHF